MKKHLLTLFVCFAFLNNYSQNHEFCGTYEVLKNWLNTHPEIKADYLKHQREAKAQDSIASLQGYSHKSAAATVYTIPVVFHVLHQNGVENISDAQIYDAMAILNRDFRKMNADTINIFPPFQAADCNIEFRLATKDTLGNCTTGITRRFDAKTNWSIGNPNDYSYTWNSSRYLNFYVVKSFGPGSGVAAYSSFPGTNPPFMDVIVTLHNYVGSIGTGNAFGSRTLTHEVGHWFDLHHVWGDTQNGTICGDDGVNDTPVTKGWNTCPGSPQAVCNPTITENHQNYMEYSFCEFMFSAGQAVRMAAALNSTVSGRSNLWITSNLIATGIINPVSPCTLSPDFMAAGNIYTVCSGQLITFTDATFNGTVTSRTWSATGSATVNSPNAASTSIIFPAAGTNTVTLQVTNGAGSATTTKTVLVLNGIADVNFNYSESFENPGLPPNFSVINTDMDVTWIQTSLAAATGSNSYYINGSANAPASNPDILETCSYDFAADPSATFTFKYAYAQLNPANADVFKVQASSDCGATWFTVYQPSNVTMAAGSGGVSNVPFVPTPEQFKTYTLTEHPNFTNFLNAPYVKLRFSFTEDGNAGYGNNIYLDDINFNSVAAGINTLSKSIAFNLYPNPTNGSVFIRFTLGDNSEIKYGVTDITGRIVEQEKVQNLDPGSHTLTLNGNQKFKPGIYFVNFEVNGQRMARKLIIQ